MANRLAKETSPYLLQHAHNPVDWYPWGEEALNRAKNEGKPILVSIGYSACHWCHVMERESFEDAEVAAIMNQHFVNIKIDREERPDLDHLYMDAVQAMTGSGGWPLNVFLTPGAKPFYGGTYFPPTRAFNRPAWRDVLLSMHQTFEQKRDQVEDQSVYLLEHLAKSNLLERQPREGAASTVISLSSLETAKNSLLANADRQEGGFGQAPKFPQTFLIRFLLRDYYGTGDESSMKQALLSLDKMVRGGIFDQAGGGFARYSTDERWLAPHFEKMLYDNALLVAALAEAYQLTQDPEYRRAITHTLDFVKKELTSPEGGFYSALDADSEGEEGKYYVWDAQEIRSLLGKNAELFCAFFGVTESGNWEGTNILHRPLTIDAFSAKHQLDAEETRKIMESGLHLLYEHRQLRVRPQLDDKILLGWNALMVSAYCKAYAALGEDEYRAVAVRGMGFLLERFAGEGIHFFHHSYKDSKAKVPAFLDDYASLIAALIDLQEVTGDINYLLKARDVLSYCEANFSDEKGAFFYFTHQDQQDIVLRKKEIYDGATASGNAIMAANLLNLGVVFDRSDWKARAAANVEQLGELIISHPASFGVWATLIQALAYGQDELVIMGRNLDRLRADLLARFIPFRVLQSATEENHEFPLLRKKPISGQAKIFLCRDYSCQNPVTEVDELIPLLESRKS